MVPCQHDHPPVASITRDRALQAVARRWAVIPRTRINRDLAAIAFLLILVALTAWARFSDDVWMSRVDILQQQLPYYTFLGEQFAAGSIPGRSPFQLSGQPFLADPLSGMDAVAW